MRRAATVMGGLVVALSLPTVGHANAAIPPRICTDGNETRIVTESIVATIYKDGIVIGEAERIDRDHWSVTYPDRSLRETLIVEPRSVVVLSERNGEESGRKRLVCIK